MNDSNAVYIVVSLVVRGLFTWLSYSMAVRRDRSGPVWGFLGFVFGIIPPIILLVMGQSHSHKIYDRKE